jgi:glycosyltransferase involved in cell wall biosynthesis
MAVPNGVDTDYFVPTGEPEDPCSMVFVGSFAFDPANVDAATYLIRDVFPAIRRRLPQATLTVVGRDPPGEVLALSGEGVRVIASPDDVRPYLSRASLVVLPMRSGAGTKVRIAAAMAMGKAILTTPLGSEGLDAVPGEDIEVADSQAFADAAVELLSDPQRRREMGRRARTRAVSDLDWRIVGLRLEALYRQVLGENLAPVGVQG